MSEGDLISPLVARWKAVRERIDEACRREGRSPSEVTLVAVSKKHPPEAIRALYAAGQRDFGENYAQELEQKRTALADLPGLRWHFIGALQSNKAKLVVPGCELTHAVERESVAEALSRRAAAAGVIARVLVGVNIGGEASKAGLASHEVSDFVRRIASLPALEVAGLMCIPPPVDSDDEAKPHFRALRCLRDAQRSSHPSLTLLSMGMTDDFEAAIAEGATHVRIGTAIFGPRPARTV